jgi:hypothetical protein
MRFLTIREKLGRPECPYMERWAINFYFFSLRIHHWFSSDDNRAFHDHPNSFLTVVLSGSYTDVNPHGREEMCRGKIKYRPALHKHTVEVSKGGCWTFVIFGRKVRSWGFWVRNGEKFMRSNKYFLERGHHPCN